MSLLHQCPEGYIISHGKYIEGTNRNFNDGQNSGNNYAFKHSLFHINTPFKMNSQRIQSSEDVLNQTDTSSRWKRKRKLAVKNAEAVMVQEQCTQICDKGKAKGIFNNAPSKDDLESNNNEAQQIASTFHHANTISASHGGNVAHTGLVTYIEKEPYLIPPRCKFFCYNVRDMDQKLTLLEPPYDLILLDPPWWNKYIRRKKAHCKTSSYEMMYNNELANIPIKKLASPDTLVVVWCTNCEAHFKCLCNEVFPAWGVEYVARWFWVKVTRSGEPICSFSEPPGKQPFEQIVFAKSRNRCWKLKVPENNKIIVSVPSAIHSHKPPLSEVLSEYLPNKPACLEIFARYLLPGWSSWGLEVLKLQHCSLYEKLSAG